MTDPSGTPHAFDAGTISRMAACGVASRNYLAYGKVVAESWLAHHPGSTFTLVIFDGDPTTIDWRPDGVEVIGLAELGIERDEAKRMAAMYSPVELATALKPWALRYALQRAEVAVYFDGDIEVMAPMHSLAPLALDGVVLTPHNLRPLPTDGLLPNPFTMLFAGMYNAGFVAVSANDGGFIDWWCSELARNAIVDVAQGMHSDQRWLDFVPSYFPHHVLRDPTCNVAYWNLHERPVEWVDDQMVIEGRPVRFFHYSGLSADTGWRLSQFLGNEPRIRLTEQPAVARACRRWIRRLDEAGRADDRAVSYGFATTANGLVLDVPARRAYRLAVLDHEAGNGAEPPNPFADDRGVAFESWLLDPPEPGGVSRYARYIWNRSAPMQTLYPDIDGADARGWNDWLAANGHQGAGVPRSTLARLGLDQVPEPFPEPDDHLDEEPPVPDESEATTSADEPDLGALPLPDLDAAWELLQRPLTDGSASRLGPPAKVAYRVANHLQHERDARVVDLGNKLVASIDELRRRLLVVGPRLDHVTKVDLPTHGVRLSILDEATVSADKARAELSARVDDRLAELNGRLDDLARRFEGQVERIDGALEQDTITANVVSDTEQRLHAELKALRRKVAELEPHPSPGATDPA